MGTKTTVQCQQCSTVLVRKVFADEERKYLANSFCWHAQWLQFLSQNINVRVTEWTSYPQTQPTHNKTIILHDLKIHKDCTLTGYLHLLFCTIQGLFHQKFKAIRPQSINIFCTIKVAVYQKLLIHFIRMFDSSSNIIPNFFKSFTFSRKQFKDHLGVFKIEGHFKTSMNSKPV